jgi:subtilase family serine protease
MKKNAIILAVFLVLSLLLPASSANALSSHLSGLISNRVDGSQTLLGHVPSAIASSKFQYHANSNEALDLQIELPLRHPDQLDSLLANIYNPQSPLYHQWLTPAQFTAQFGYTGAEIDSLLVKEFMGAQGITVTGQSANGLIVRVRGNVPAIENAFGVHINHYIKADGRPFFATDTNPTIPAQLAGKIVAIGGLDNLPKFKPHFQAQGMRASANALLGTGPGGYLAPSDVKTAYNLTVVPASGSGQTVALFELDGYTASDITHYEAQFGLPNVPLQNVLIDGFNGVPDYNNFGGAYEVTLDIEILTGFAPGSNIMVYEAANTTQSWIDEWSRIASDNKAKAVSCSWGEPEIDSPTLNFDNTIFQQMASQGQAVFVAAGDSGAFDAGGSTLAVDEPASQPFVTAVGISKLTFNSNETYGSESASVYGGGGHSVFFSIPPYQITMASHAQAAAKVSQTMRNLPDVALTADAATGYAFYIKNSWGGFYGSSISAPIWASFLSLVNQGLGSSGPLGFANPWLYQTAQNSANYANDFHDIATGNNGYYPAMTGFDDAVGLGSFNGLNLYNALTSTTAATPPSAPTGLAASAGNARVSLSWNSSAGAVSYNVLRSTQNGGPYTSLASSVLMTYTDTAVTNGTTYYYVVTAVNSAGPSGYSNQASAKPVLPPPGAPTGLKATAGNAQVALSWNAVSTATSYNVLRSTSSTGTFTAITNPVSNTNYTDTTAVNGTTYYYVVSANNSGGTGPNSAQVSATPAMITVAPPTNLTGKATKDGRQPAILLQWNKSTSPNIKQYNIYRSTGTATPVLYGSAAASASGVYDLGVTHGITYNYDVTAVNNTGIESKPSNKVTVVF